MVEAADRSRADIWRDQAPCLGRHLKRPTTSRGSAIHSSCSKACAGEDRRSLTGVNCARRTSWGEACRRIREMGDSRRPLLALRRTSRESAS